MNKIILDIKSLFQKYIAAYAQEDIEKFTTYFFIILTIVVVCFFGLTAIGPTLNTVGNLNKQYDDNMVVYEALSQKLANLALLDSQYQSLKSRIANIYSAIPRTSNMPILTRQLENLAQEHNLTITRLTFAAVEVFPNVKNDPVYSFTFTINVAGNEKSVNNFIADVINFDRIIGIDQIATGINTERQYTTSLTGRAYFSPK